jgi:hypothetical protein
MNIENYGFVFNNITITEESVLKTSKNSFGNLKINFLSLVQNKLNIS